MYIEFLNEENFKQGMKIGDKIVWRMTGDVYTKDGWESKDVEDIVTGFDYPFILTKSSPSGFHYSRFSKIIDQV